jgi:hypothetical protein
VNGTGGNAAPFDQDFYLIMNVAVGGTNGWFPDGQGDKPWLNHAGSASSFLFPLPLPPFALCSPR